MSEPVIENYPIHTRKQPSILRGFGVILIVLVMTFYAGRCSAEVISWL